MPFGWLGVFADARKQGASVPQIVSNAFRLVRRFRPTVEKSKPETFALVSNAFRLVRRFRQKAEKVSAVPTVAKSPMPFGWLGVFAS